MREVSQDDLVQSAVNSLLEEIALCQRERQPIAPMVALLRQGILQIRLSPDNDDCFWIQQRKNHRRRIPEAWVITVRIPEGSFDAATMVAAEEGLEARLRPLVGMVIGRALQTHRERALEVNRALS